MEIPTMSRADTGCAWAVKESFLAYIRGLRDGQVTLADGAAVTSTGEFYFPFKGTEKSDGVTTLRFGGTVRFAGHYGFMSVLLEDLRIVLDHGSGTLLHGASQMQTLADLVLPEPSSEQGVLMWAPVPACLAASGVELFGDTYKAGEELAPLTVRIPAEVLA
jgi:hypothetical protein